MKNLELANKFLVKAQQDFIAVREMIHNNNISDEIIGFHCQQAAEKILKAVLIFNHVNFRKTHDLTELIDILADHQIILPDNLANIDELTPFAVEYRYDFNYSQEQIDREKYLQLVSSLKAWANTVINT